MNFSFYTTSTRLFALILMTIPLTTLAKEKAAYVEFTTDSNRCISEEVFVHAQSSGRSTNAKVTFSIYRQDICRDMSLLAVKVNEAQLKKGQLVFDDELSGASLNGSITVVDKLTKERYEVILSLNWKADADLISADKNRDMTEPPSEETELSTTEKYEVTYRDAAARGTIVIDGDQLNFATTRGAYLVSTDSEEQDKD